MFSTCNTDCAGAVTMSLTSQCNTYQRSEVPVRLILAKCDTDFPSGTYDDAAHATAFANLISAGDVTATFELSDFVWGEPVTTSKQYRSRCRPAQLITTSRQLTARDYTATDVDESAATSKYEDRLFYQNVLKNKGVAIRGYVTCEGMVYLFLNANGTFASYSLSTYIGYDTDVDGKNVEYKNIVATFTGDPIDNVTTPYLDIVGAGAVASLGWLFQQA